MTDFPTFHYDVLLGIVFRVVVQSKFNPPWKKKRKFEQPKEESQENVQSASGSAAQSTDKSACRSTSTNLAKS